MAKNELEVVKGLDLARYMDRWYEIASFPSRDQPKNGTNTRATYTLKDDGTVNVLNETWSDGKRGFIEGTAYKADPNSDEAKLKVKFYLPPFLPIIPITGDYSLLYTDDDFRYALVGQPSRKNLLILCRKNQIDEELYNQLLEKAKGQLMLQQGYDVSKLKRTKHTDPPPEGVNEQTDSKGTWWLKSIFGK
ncbi:temperature-induced lipocalin-1-like [Bidens hawaiensis]|uniref:temperature-induced lipocalin-1-like n=1 Tax=Bidens hawaiensis TaxID=980011 RepID=UPI004049DCF8